MLRAGNCDGWPASKQFYYLNVKRASRISQTRDKAPSAELGQSRRIEKSPCARTCEISFAII